MNKMHLQSYLFAAGKPVGFLALARALGVEEGEVRGEVGAWAKTMNAPESGIHVLETQDQVQLVTNPAASAFLQDAFRQEVAGELTRPSLETLTIIAYRGPVTRPEIEEIRGVNCSLILRNLLMRGLIEERDDATKLQAVYSVSADFLRHMGLHSIQELPDFTRFNDHKKITDMLVRAHEEPTV
ncbi:SMC-Scp complex subunit ScpB [Candidatus Uhrbacteria bacterium]|nr:SMC-Scp complex subunit ScpB [Candidatus Uhrbacteria bacterium]